MATGERKTLKSPEDPMNVFIGDIHGRCKSLHALLLELGFQFSGTKILQPVSRPIKLHFVGDIVDGTKSQTQTIKFVYHLCRAGHAETPVMGNHEFRAICMAIKGSDGEYILSRDGLNLEIANNFLNDFPFGSDEHQWAIEWFKTFPLFIEAEAFRVVHAYWDDGDIKTLRPFLDDNNCLTEEAYEAYALESQPMHDALNRILRGPVVHFSEDFECIDRYGRARNTARVHWWEDPEFSLISDVVSLENNRVPVEIEDDLRVKVTRTSLREVFHDVSKPTFIGHYSIEEGCFIAGNVVVLDGRQKTNAYCWKGSDLSGENFISVEYPGFTPD